MIVVLAPHLPSSDGIGASDCEAIRDAALTQPVNALTSLAYVIIGLAIVIVALRGRRNVVSSSVYGACLVAIGAGSVLFHGPQPDGSQLLHDLPILVTVLFIVVHDTSLVLTGLRRKWTLFGVLVAAATALTAIDSELGAAATGVGVASIVVLETLIYRRRARNLTSRRQFRAYATIIAVACVAAATWLLGRTGSPACDPDAVFQFHGVWHMISAVVFGIWWWLALWTNPSGMGDNRRASRSTDVT